MKSTNSLADHGFSIKLWPIHARNLRRGCRPQPPRSGCRRQSHEIRSGGKTRWHADGGGGQVLPHPNHPDPVRRSPPRAEIASSSPFSSQLDWVRARPLVEQIESGMERCSVFRDLLVPMVDIDEKVDISWLIELRTVASWSSRLVSPASQAADHVQDESAWSVAEETPQPLPFRSEMCAMPKPDWSSTDRSSLGFVARVCYDHWSW